MGAWGPGLYSDDVTEDVRGIYVDKLHRGKNGEQASKEMIAEFEWAWSDEDDAPVPAERSCLTSLWQPQHQQHDSHHEALVDIVPALHHHAVQSHTSTGRRSHEVFVVKTADCPQQRGEHDEINPTVVLEVDAFFLAATTEHEE